MNHYNNYKSSVTLHTSPSFKSLPPSFISKAYQVVVWSFVDIVALKEILKKYYDQFGGSPTSVRVSVIRRYRIMLRLLAMLRLVSFFFQMTQCFQITLMTCAGYIVYLMKNLLLKRKWNNWYSDTR